MVRQASKDDIPRIAEIHVYGWRYAYTGLLQESLLFKDRTVVGSLEMYETLVSKSPEALWVFDDGIIRAFMIIGPSRDEDLRNAFELQAIYVEPAFVRRGIGSAMIKVFEEEAARKSYPEANVWVLEENYSGRSFYEKNGFVVDGKRTMLTAWERAEIRYRKAVNAGSPEPAGLWV